jgi:hypothetical protein
MVIRTVLTNMYRDMWRHDMKKKNHQTLSMTFFSNTVKYYLEFKKKHSKDLLEN